MSDDGTFRRLDREVLVDNAWHRYCRDRYVQRDGSEGDYYYVDMPGSCASIPVFDDGTMVLIKAHRYLLGIDLWEFPIGGMKPGDGGLSRNRLCGFQGLYRECLPVVGSRAIPVTKLFCRVVLQRQDFPKTDSISKIILITWSIP